MKISSCPKYQKCNAPICPLDEDWRKRACLPEDSACYYLIESVKDGAKTHFEEAQLEELYECITKVREDIAKHFKRIAKKMQLASKTSSRMARKFMNKKESA